MKKNSYKKNTKLIISEINSILSKIPQSQTNILIEQIILAERIFLVAIGRVNLSLQCFGKRLSHLGFKIELVGSLTEKPATKKDLLIVASGSGESIVPLQITKKSSIRKIANFVVELNAPSKVDKLKKNEESLSDSASKTKTSVQPMSTLFDQALHIYGDVVSTIIIQRLKLDKFKLWKNHANLE